jgi:ABC-type antimicrobial peptide transport system permease subunit
MLAYFVIQRQREIAIRLALGANARRIAHFTFGNTGWVIVAGLTSGYLAYRLVGRVLLPVLYGTDLADSNAAIFAVLLVLLTAVGALAIPTVRAIHLDPAATLRE